MIDTGEMCMMPMPIKRRKRHSAGDARSLVQKRANGRRAGGQQLLEKAPSLVSIWAKSVWVWRDIERRRTRRSACHADPDR